MRVPHLPARPPEGALRKLLLELLTSFLKVLVVVILAVAVGLVVVLSLGWGHDLSPVKISNSVLSVAIFCLSIFDWAATIMLFRAALRHVEVAEVRARWAQFTMNAIGSLALSAVAVNSVLRYVEDHSIIPAGGSFVLIVVALLLFSAQSILFVLRQILPRRNP